MDRDDLVSKVQQVQTLLEAKFGVRSRSLSQGLRRTGRRLPRRMRQQGQVLAQAEKMTGSAKLWRQVDRAAVLRAFEALKLHLEAIDVAKRRKDRVLNLVALLAFQFLVVLAAFIWLLWWLGYV